MGFSDKLKELRSKAEDAVVEHKDQIQETVQKVGEAADQKTGGKYRGHIEKAGSKASGFVEGLGDQEPGGGQPAAGTPSHREAPQAKPESPSS